jgi:Pyruvate/2-oxoacid:ferredoxin oxidoreductase delta subunit
MEDEMREEVYRQLLEVMKKRGGRWPGMDIPEFYEMAEELFSPEEAQVNNAMPKGPTTAKDLAKEIGRDESEIERILERMADKGLCVAVAFGDTQFYQASRFAIGIMDYQFMRGTTTERDKKLARLIHAYKQACDAKDGPVKLDFPTLRVIPVDRTIGAKNTIHTYDQVQTYIDKYDPIAAGACYCRHEAALLGEDTHGVPVQVCMTFGMAAQFTSQRLGARIVTKDEARDLLDQAEAAGLVHMSMNTTEDIQFLCNCDRWHCNVIKMVLDQSRPAMFFNSGFEPRVDPGSCTGCKTCIDRCPASARKINEQDVPEVDFGRCFGCAVCATGCPSNAIVMVSKPGFPKPPKDDKSLREAIRSRTS